MLRDIILVIARLLMALLFLSGGLPKVRGSVEGRAAIAGLGLPAASLLERTVGTFMVGAALALLSGIWVRIASLLLAAFVLAVTPLFMPFWSIGEAEARTKVREAFFDNVGIIGGLAALAAAGAGSIALLPGT